MYLYPIISIAIATFNSQRILEETLKSIKKQTYPKKKIEILIIDGGSSDQTLSIAKKYNCKIIHNPKMELVFAKHIGFLKATGKYLIYLDSDEVLENPNSLKIKYAVFKKNPNVKAVMLSGYKTAPNSALINYYINEFGDPFSYFIYRESKGEKFLIKEWLKKYRKISEDKKCIIFNFENSELLPLVELWAGGCMIDLQYIRFKFPQIKNNPSLIAHLFYLLSSKKKLIAITKNDNTIHFSSESLARYLKKIASRVKNNVFLTEMGSGGFLGREALQPNRFKIKKYLFPFYAFSIILPSIDAIMLYFTRRKFLYLIHLPLCIYTSLLIIYYLFLKTFGIKPKIKGYGF